MATSNPRQAWLQGLVARYADGDVQAFSERVGINRTTVSLLLHGHREMSDKYAIRICNKLKVDPPRDMALDMAEVTGQPIGEPIGAALGKTEELLQRILRAQEEQALLLKTLTELIIARNG